MSSLGERGEPQALLSVRAAVVLVVGVLAGVGAAVLTGLSGSPWPTAVLAGAGAFAGGVLFAQSVIG
ncbi:hypothetical protein ACFY3O_12310 [Streptomyces sp. NPDC001046]|uniref:hypothetical protein n=1 Tax=unclassified Streptomyces TaxID=2593676 RepID=UPI000EFA8188|nr:MULTISPECIES: hypothetical protein [unclassified Streptomyces]MBJ6633855.1 hypothetical protein [Streptomyces sp. I5]RMI89015.1 hypothetical protein BIU87_31785 [Streptomyces sp. ZS0098]